MGVLSLLFAALSPMVNCFNWSLTADTSIMVVSGDVVVVGVVEELFVCLTDGIALYLGTGSENFLFVSSPN